MSLKIYSKTSYKEYQSQSTSESDSITDTIRVEKISRPPINVFRAFLYHNKFFLLTLILLGTSLVLIGHLLLVLTSSESDEALNAEVQAPVVEIIKLPHYEQSNELSSDKDVWECADGSYVSTPADAKNCQKIPSIEPTGNQRHRFITRDRVFHDER